MSDPAELFNEALSAIERGDAGVAAARLEVVVQAQPEDAEALLMLAELRRDEGDFTAAEAILVDGTDRTPGAVSLWVELAALRLVRGDAAGAADACREALTREPESWEALYLLGDAFFDAQAYCEAVKAYNLSLESNPFEPEIWHNLGEALAALGDHDGAQAARDTYACMRRTGGDLDCIDVMPTRPVGPDAPEGDPR